MGLDFREERLVLWDRLIRGETVSVEECCDVVGRLAADAGHEEKSSCVLLVASARVANERSEAMRNNLRAALKYWFSQSGTKDRPDSFDASELEGQGLESLPGLYLSWPEALEAIGRTKPDYTALTRITERLRTRCAEEWERLLGSAPPKEIT